MYKCWCGDFCTASIVDLIAQFDDDCFSPVVCCPGCQFSDGSDFLGIIHTYTLCVGYGIVVNRNVCTTIDDSAALCVNVSSISLGFALLYFRGV